MIIDSIAKSYTIIGLVWLIPLVAIVAADIMVERKKENGKKAIRNRDQ